MRECMVTAEGCLHLPSALVTGLSGISPNSSLELDRDTVVAALPWLLWLAPEFDRFSGGGVRRCEYILGIVDGVACKSGYRLDAGWV